MPESDGERCYRIKHPTEPHERIATQRVEVLLLASDGKPKHPAGPPMTLDTCGPSDGAIRTAVPGGKVMEWFSRRSIDSWHSVSELGASCGRRYRILSHLRINYLTVGERYGREQIAY